jgi:O-antigen ligase
MHSLTATAAEQRLGESALSFRVLCVLVAILLAILPLAHVTGMRNTLVGFIAGFAVLHYRTALWKENPTLWPWLPWLGFAAMSIAWSTLPRVSFQSFRTDLLYPFVLFIASFLMVRSSGGRTALAAGAIAGTLMSLATVVAVLVDPPEPKADAPGSGVLGWLAWKAGDAVDLSTFIAFVAVPLFLLLLTSRKTFLRIGAGMWLIVFAGLGIVSESRTLVVSLFMSLACFVIVLGLLRGKLRWRSVALALGIGLLVSAASVEVISRLRLPGPQPLGRSAAMDMLATDSRPAIWSAYLELARKHPWFGIGFGRSVPSKTYRLDGNSDLRHIDMHAPTHAHNVLLGLVLGVGVVGLAIWVWLHVTLLRFALQQGRRRGDFEKAWAAAAVALVLAMLVKNSTDDLMVFGNALLFWSLLGAMLGLVWWGDEGGANPAARRGAGDGIKKAGR